MRKRWLAIAILFATAFAFVEPIGMTQNRRSKPVQQKIVPFDISMVELPPQYQGTNVVAVFKLLSLRSSNLEKGEFETTEQHLQRLKQLESLPLVGTVTSADLLAFTIESIDIESEYNADAQTLQVAILISKVLSRTEFRDLPTLSVKGTFTDEGSYLGTNAFGVTARVTKSKIESYELAYANARDFAVSEYVRQRNRKSVLNPDSALLFQLPMDAPMAMRTKSNVQALAIVRLLSPYVSEDTHYSKATIDNPNAYYHINQYLKAHLTEVWLYDKLTGRIYFKARPGMLEGRALVTAEPKQKVLLQLENGTVIEVDEAWEQGESVWYKKAKVTLRLERSQVKAIVRRPSP